MLTLLFGNAFAATSLNSNTSEYTTLTDKYENINISLDFDNEELLAQLMDKCQNIKGRYGKYDVDFMEKKFEENKNIIVSKDGTSLSKAIVRQSKIFEK